MNRASLSQACGSADGQEANEWNGIESKRTVTLERQEVAQAKSIEPDAGGK